MSRKVRARARSVRAHVRRLTSLARLVAPFSPDVYKLDGEWVRPCSVCHGLGAFNGRDCPGAVIQRGPGHNGCYQGTEPAHYLVQMGAVHFDVHAARELGQQMVAMADEQTVFEDWCRGRGRGPEAVGMRVRCLDECIKCICDTNPETTDGPDVDCLHHGWGRRVKAVIRGWGRCECNEKPPWDGTTKLTQWPGKLARAYAKAGGKASAAVGRSIARQGQRLLDVLEGQPSECQAGCSRIDPTAPPRGAPRLHKYFMVLRRVGTGHSLRTCPDCKGTGHNLAGTLGKLPGNIRGEHQDIEVLDDVLMDQIFERVTRDIEEMFAPPGEPGQP